MGRIFSTVCLHIEKSTRLFSMSASLPLLCLLLMLQVRLSRCGLSPHELTQALCHLLNSRSQQRRDHTNTSATGTYVRVGGGAGRSTVGTPTGTPLTAPGSPRSSQQRTSSPRAPSSPPEASLPVFAQPQAVASRGARAVAESASQPQIRKVTFTDKNLKLDGPSIVENFAANTNGATASNDPIVTTRIGSTMQADAVIGASSTKQASGGSGLGPTGERGGMAPAGNGWPWRPVFSGQDWRLLEPQLMRFCHKVQQQEAL